MDMRSSIRQSQHFLRQWGYFDENVELLSELELSKMKTLYAALKQLTEEQRSFLADKYRVFEGSAVPDHELAKKYNMTLKEYRKLRHWHEDCFRKHLDEARSLYIKSGHIDGGFYNKRQIQMKMTLRAARVNAGYNLDQAAEELKINPDLLSNYEKDSSNMPHDLIEKIEDVYAFPPSSIYFGVEEDYFNKIKSHKEVAVN